MLTSPLAQDLLEPAALRLHLLDGASGCVVQELADFLDGEEATLAALGLAARLSPFHMEVWVADPAEVEAQRAATAAVEAVEQGAAGKGPSRLCTALDLEA